MLNPTARSRRKIAGLLLLSAIGFYTGCIRKKTPAPHYELGLYSGVENLVRLGDTEQKIRERYPSLVIEPVREPADLVDMKVTEVVIFPDSGVRAYLRTGRVVLIELQEPFRGRVQGRKMEIFPFSKPPGKTWEESLTRELGQPVDAASGGRLASSALFYPWGDISYNSMGPNQIAIYRDGTLAKYRQHSFGRVIRFFPKN